MKINNIFKLIISVGVSEIVGIGGALFTSPAVSSSWYSSLEKPALNPPSWIFSPVWITLYAMMGVAAFLVWSLYSKASEGQEKRKIKTSLGIFGIQLFLNAAWSVIFFGLRSPGWAFVNIIVLLLAIAWTMIVFYGISPSSSNIRTADGRGKLAAYLLAPYILWVSFACYLNYSIWILN